MCDPGSCRDLRQVLVSVLLWLKVFSEILNQIFYSSDILLDWLMRFICRCIVQTEETMEEGCLQPLSFH